LILRREELDGETEGFYALWREMAKFELDEGQMVRY
jgi:hypothetical protein